jgi:ribosome biogenesis GTPase A
MTIEWYPGHMATARREAMETMRTTDVVIEVLDARVPLASLNPVFEALRRENRRPALKVLNKVDAADPAQTPGWLAWYNAQPGVKAVALSARKAGEVKALPAACLSLAPGRGTKDKPLRLMILGIPNVGKSTLMNTLLSRRVAHVGDEPAITKHQMRHELGPGMSLVDTPGMLWPGLAQDVALKLAATHSIGRNAYDEADVAVHLGTYLVAHYSGALARRYAVTPEVKDGFMLLEWIAKRQSLVKKGGTPDTQKAAAVLLNDFRAGALGRVSLETAPEPG